MKISNISPKDQLPNTGDFPEYVRTSLAAYMTMGKTLGKFYRNAKLYCINLLLTYDEGCHAKCAYCGLSKSRKIETSWADSSFIRVDWPILPLEEVKAVLVDGTCSHVERVCVSMITIGKAREDCLLVVSELSEVIDHISVLITPTIVNKDWLRKIKNAGADMIGIAVDAATPELFDQLRGIGVQGPHRWKKYWETIQEAVEVFGEFKTGIHLIVGIGETEKQMVEVIQKAYDMCVLTHLFSFYPEEGSVMEDYPQPPIGMYRRVQLARYAINKGLTSADKMKFNEIDQITDFGLEETAFEKLMLDGTAFMTSGCPGPTLEFACNRPFGNCTPYQASIGDWRNFPFKPNKDDLEIIRRQLIDYSLSYQEDVLDLGTE